MNFKHVLLTSLVVGSMILSGCGGDSDKKNTSKDELTISVGANLVAGKFDPTLGYGVWAPDIFHSHILTVGKDNNLIFDLATDAKVSADGLVYTYTLRKDAVFSDGKPLTAKDVVFTFEKTMKQASAADLTMLEKVVAKDDYTVAFTLKKKWSTFPYSLSEIGIVPAHAYKDGYGDHPIGSGPWRVVELKKNQQLILEPNEHYYGTKSKFKRVNILKMDEDTALAAAKSGQVDLILINGESSRTKVNGMKVLVLKTIDSFAINLPTIKETSENGEKIGNNVTSDLAIRQALNIGIDRAEIIKNALNGLGEPAYGVSSHVPWSNDIKFEDNKVEEAKKILEAAGWKDTDGDGVREKDGLKAEFTITGRSNDLDRYNTVVALAQDAKKLGIKINPKSEAWAVARKARAIPTCWTFAHLNPVFYYRNYESGQIGKQVIGNSPSYNNPLVDKEIYNALNSDEVTVSYKHWINAQNLADKDVPFLYITSPSLVYFAKDGLNIPDLGKFPIRGQGISVVEYMNTWTWDNK